MKRRVAVHMENWVAKIPFRISRHTSYDFPCINCEIGQNGVIGRGLSEDERWALIEYLKSI